MLKKMLLALATTTMLAPAALAGHDEAIFVPSNRLVILADDLADASATMRYQAARRLHGRNAAAGDVLRSLDRLELQASRFRAGLVRGASPRRLEFSYDRLLAAFDSADDAMRFVPNGRLQREFRQVEVAMGRLARTVETARAPGRPLRDDGLHGSIVFGNRAGNTGFRVRIGF